MTPEKERYELVRHLASGGMGHVYTAWDRVQARPVALKLAAATALARRCLAKESAWVRRLDHPNVVRVFDSGKTRGGRPYFSMEFIAGGSLHDAIAGTGPLGVRDASLLVSQLCEAVAAVHRAALVHRDLKPANIMLQRSHRGTEVKLIDFGLATRLTAKRNFSKSVAGTPGYIAPELVGGAPADERSDVFSLGAILRFVLTGRTPRADAPTVVLDPRGGRAAASIDATLPEAARNLMARCLSEDPDARPRTAVELAELLSGLCSDSGIASSPFHRGTVQNLPSSRIFGCNSGDTLGDTLRDSTALSRAC